MGWARYHFPILLEVRHVEEETNDIPVCSLLNCECGQDMIAINYLLLTFTLRKPDEIGYCPSDNFRLFLKAPDGVLLGCK